MSKYNCEKCGKELRPNELKYVSCGSYEFICNDCAEKQIPSKLMKKIADLEAKLAERNEYFSSFGCEDFNEFQDFISTFMLTPHEEQELIQQLKQQLAEKEEEIKKLKSQFHHMCKGVRRYDFGELLIENTQLKVEHNQDKISFCIEKLEKVKDYADVDYRNRCYIDAVKLDKFIDNQIEELKKGL